MLDISSGVVRIALMNKSTPASYCSDLPMDFSVPAPVESEVPPVEVVDISPEVSGDVPLACPGARRL